MTDYVATRWYRAPELILGCNSYGREVDMWAIGCIMGELIDGQPLFPGDNDIDQLSKICNVLGKLPDCLVAYLNKNPKFIGKLSELNGGSEHLDKKYNGKLPKRALDFMKYLLNMEPSARPSCEQALNHIYFEGIVSSKHDSNKSKLTSKIQLNEKIKNIINTSNSGTQNTSEIRKSPTRYGQKPKVEPSKCIKRNRHITAPACHCAQKCHK